MLATILNAEMWLLNRINMRDPNVVSCHAAPAIDGVRDAGLCQHSGTSEIEFVKPFGEGNSTVVSQKHSHGTLKESIIEFHNAKYKN